MSDTVDGGYAERQLEERRKMVALSPRPQWETMVQRIGRIKVELTLEIPVVTFWPDTETMNRFCDMGWQPCFETADGYTVFMREKRDA